jgi:hypothetical protein
VNSDPLVDRLREEAQAFAPQLPPGLHKRLASALAAAPFPKPARSRLVWWTTATLATAAVALAIFLLRDRGAVEPVAPTPQPRQWAIKPLTSPDQFPLTTNPISLAQQWVEKPLQREVNSFMNQLTSAGDTLTGALPAAPKWPRPRAL